jgi:hypothetical protein
MPAPPDGAGMLAEGEDCSPEPPPPAGALAEQLQSVTVMVFTTVTGDPERGDSEGPEGAGAGPELSLGPLDGAGADPEGVDSGTGAELAGVD